MGSPKGRESYGDGVPVVAGGVTSAQSGDRESRSTGRRDLYLLAYGNIYSNSGAMTPGASEETADGMSEDKIDQITGLMRREKYRFSPARRVYIPKKNGKLRPLGLPSWSDKLTTFNS
jgi:retron-type reverse transcriptase